MDEQQEQPQQPNESAGPSGSQPGGEGGAPAKEERTMALLAHLLGIVIGFVGPLIIWLIKKDESPFIDDQGKEALNFQLTVLIALVVSSALTFVVIGCFLLPLVAVVNVVFCIIAAIRANEGQRYRYPVTIRMIS